MRPSFVITVITVLVTVTSSERVRRQSVIFPKESAPITGTSCLDHAGKKGTCGSIKQCPSLNRIISGGRRPSAEEVTILRDSVCDRQSKQVLLCCAREESVTSRPSSPKQIVQESVVAFTGAPEDHPNRAVLERGFRCGFTSHDAAGEKSDLAGQHPWLAQLGYTTSQSDQISHQCGGVLIGDQHVLTAAHCVTDLPAGFALRSVRLVNGASQEADCKRKAGGDGPCSAPVDAGIASTYVHADYNKPTPLKNDIALLKLDQPVAEDAVMLRKICLPFGRDRLVRDYTQTSLTVAGFRRGDSPLSSSGTGPLQAETVTGVSQRACAATLRPSGTTLGRSQLCAAATRRLSGEEEQVDSCLTVGDSGGPLIRRGFRAVVVGVESLGVDHCRAEDVPGVYTRVSDYLNWILDRVAL